jgi:hypothetical protein
MLHELKALDAYRLTHDLSFRALETEMIAAGCPVGSRALHALLREKRGTPSERTLYKVRRFLAIIADRRKDARRGTTA